MTDWCVVYEVDHTPYAIKLKVEKELGRLVKSGVMEPVSTSEWATPIVPVMKKDGTPRICGDFKVTVNPFLIAEQYPLPLIDDLFAGLAGEKKFSKIDLDFHIDFAGPLRKSHVFSGSRRSQQMA